uniref:Uncharacterized protein n=1 Tax=Rhizophora mucronata TaxID=61149 RepID=A0A2P2QAZ9_RHIMU
MAGKFAAGVLLVLSLIHLALSIDPSPSFEPAAHSPSISAPSPPPDTGSQSEPPISPSPSDHFSPDSSPAEAPEHTESKAPAPEPTEASDINHSSNVEATDGTESESSGISGGKKASIVIGVIAAACFVGLGGFVYKKRQQNIRRSRYAATARTELL